MLNAVAAIAPAYQQRIQAYDAYWSGSPFEWLARVGTAGQNGAVGRILIEWASQRQLSLTRVAGLGTRLRFAQSIFRLKSSSAWLPAETFTFQQIKESDEFHYLWLYGFTNRRVFMWIISRDEALQASGQHTGAGARETRWNHRIDPLSPSPWLPGRGTEGETLEKLRAIHLVQPDE